MNQLTKSIELVPIRSKVRCFFKIKIRTSAPYCDRFIESIKMNERNVVEYLFFVYEYCDSENNELNKKKIKMSYMMNMRPTISNETLLFCYL